MYIFAMFSDKCSRTRCSCRAGVREYKWKSSGKTLRKRMVSIVSMPCLKTIIWGELTLTFRKIVRLWMSCYVKVTNKTTLAIVVIPNMANFSFPQLIWRYKQTFTAIVSRWKTIHSRVINLYDVFSINSCYPELANVGFSPT